MRVREDTLIPSEVDPKLDTPDSLLTPLLVTPLPPPRQSANCHLGTPHPDSLYWAYLVILQTSPSPSWTQSRVDLLCSGFSLLPSLGFCGQFLLSESLLREGQVSCALCLFYFLLAFPKAVQMVKERPPGAHISSLKSTRQNGWQTEPRRGYPTPSGPDVKPVSPLRDLPSPSLNLGSCFSARPQACL